MINKEQNIELFSLEIHGIFQSENNKGGQTNGLGTFPIKVINGHLRPKRNVNGKIPMTEYSGCLSKIFANNTKISQSVWCMKISFTRRIKFKRMDKNTLSLNSK